MKLKTKTKNIVIIILIIITILMELLYLNYKYSKKEIITVEEHENLRIDEYNFEQLEKVKVVLKNIKRTDKKFSSLKNFNNLYNTNIKSIKNCYYIKNYENEDRVLYSFWFKLESDKYIEKFWTKNYMYPKYDLPKDKICVWECVEINRVRFIKTITNPCEE